MRIFRWSAVVLTAALGGVIGCSPGGSDCGGTNINQNENTPHSLGPCQSGFIRGTDNNCYQITPAKTQ